MAGPEFKHRAQISVKCPRPSNLSCSLHSRTCASARAAPLPDTVSSCLPFQARQVLKVLLPTLCGTGSLARSFKPMASGLAAPRHALHAADLVPGPAEALPPADQAVTAHSRARDVDRLPTPCLRGVLEFCFETLILLRIAMTSQQPCACLRILEI